MAIQYTEPLDHTFRALGDASRRRIVSAIHARGACSAGTLVELFDSSQPAISAHLKVLERAGLVQREIQGRNHIFSIRHDALAEAQLWLDRHLELWTSSLDRLGQALDEDET